VHAEVKTIELGAIDALLPDLADNPAKVEARKKWRKELSGRVLSSRWMRTAAEASPALAIELGWLLMAKGLDIDSGRPLNALQIAGAPPPQAAHQHTTHTARRHSSDGGGSRRGTAQGGSQASVPLVHCLLSLGADPKARGSLGTVSPKTLAGGNAAIIAALSAAAASRGLGGGGVTPTTVKLPHFKADENEEVVPTVGKKRKAPSPADDDAMDDDADDDEAGGGDRGATSAKRQRTEGNEVSRMAELIREWVAERWSKVTAHDWIPHHFTSFYLRAQLRQCGLQPQVRALPPF
jgi:hypothetical protein